jgi:hypothetical protein
MTKSIGKSLTPANTTSTFTSVPRADSTHARSSRVHIDSHRVAKHPTRECRERDSSTFNSLANITFDRQAISWLDSVEYSDNPYICSILIENKWSIERYTIEQLDTVRSSASKLSQPFHDHDRREHEA